MLRYPVTLKKDGNSLMATAPDFPEVGTFGENKADALVRAADAIATAIQGRISDREKIPKPSDAKRGQEYVYLSTLIAAKLALYELMIKTGMPRSWQGTGNPNCRSRLSPVPLTAQSPCG